MNKFKPKILFILENYLPHQGGVEIVFKNLCESLVNLGYDVSIITHRIKNTEKFQILNGVKIYRVNCLYSRYLFTFLSIPKVLKIAKKSDIIHTTTFNAAFPSWLASKIIGRKSVITIHEVWVNKWDVFTDMNWFKSKIYNFLEKLIYILNFDRYVCVSKSTEKRFLEIKKGVKNKIRVVYNGVDYKHWNPKDYDKKLVRNTLGLKDHFIYLFTGRPGVSKGLEYLIKAVPLISKKIPNSKLLAIISKDVTYLKNYGKILELIKELDIVDKVIILDPVSYNDLPFFVKTADCVVVPSLAEGFGFTAVEACAMGIPVIVCNTTSLPEVVSGKFILIKPKNSQSVVNGILKVYKGEFEITNPKKFEMKDNIEGYIKVYNELLN